MARLFVASFAEYDIGNVLNAPRAVLQQAVRRAAKTANQRLLRLERKAAKEGREMYGYAYKIAMKNLGDRRRFIERTDKMSLYDLRAEYAMLRDFLSAKSSTVQGQNEIDRKRYETALQRGFQGSFDEFYSLVEKYFTEATEALFSSDTVYTAIQTGTVDIIQRIVDMSIAEKIDRGSALIQYLEESRKRRGKGD